MEKIYKIFLKSIDKKWKMCYDVRYRNQDLNIIMFKKKQFKELEIY